MALPKAIQRQADEAAAAEAAIAKQAQDAQASAVDPRQLPPAPANEQGTAPPQTEATQPTAAPTAPAEDWQQKYKSLQGMFAQRTSELQTQTRQYESRLSQMQQQLDALTQARSQEDGTKQAALDPKDVENFGADMLEMVKRYAEQTFTRMADRFGSRIDALEKQVAGVSDRTESTLEQQFYATLGRLVPDWEDLNKDPRWLTWLAEIDPVYGAPRQAALDHAHKSGDVQRVANVFNTFKKANPAKAQESLATQVAPNGAAAPAPAPSPTAKPILAAKFIEKFYSDVAKGRYVGKDAEVARIEADINQAAAEGRIR